MKRKERRDKERNGKATRKGGEERERRNRLVGRNEKKRGEKEW